MSQKLTVCCVAVLLTLTSVSAVQRLKSINDLKKINFGQSVPEESLRLLYWFANTVDIDNNNVIRPTFDPDNQDYGSHPYHNSEDLLDPLPQGQRDYTIGNLNKDGSEELPDYVVNRMDNRRSNMARIIIRVREESRGMRIDQVYITQHYGTSDYRRTWYDPRHTYQVTTKLIRQIRDLSVAEINNVDDSQLQEISNTWGNLASLGLLLFIVIPEKYIRRYSNRPQPAPRRNTPPAAVVVDMTNIPENTQNRQITTDARGSDNICKCICFSLCATLVLLVISCLIYAVVVAIKKS